MARKLVAMKAKFWVEGDRRSYMAKPGAELMDVTSAPTTVCRACKHAGRGVQHHWFQSASGWTDGVATPSGALSTSPVLAWWCYNWQTSGAVTTWSGDWCGQHGGDCGRRMRSLQWTPYKRPHGRTAPWVLAVPTIENWPSGSVAHRLRSWGWKHASTYFSFGGWGIQEASYGEQYPLCGRWRRWVVCRNSSVAGFGGAQSGRLLRQWSGHTPGWRSSGPSRWRVWQSTVDGIRHAVLSFTCLLRGGEVAPIRRGGSQSRGLGFYTVKCDPRFVRASWDATARFGCGGLTLRGPHRQSP